MADVNYKIDNVKITTENTDVVTNVTEAAPSIDSSVLVLKDVKPSGTTAGTSTAGVWTDRDINTIENPQSWFSLIGNNFSLAPGVYHINITCPSFNTIRFKSRLLRNISGSGSSVVIVGTSGLNSSTSMGRSVIEGVITVAAGPTNVFTIQQHNFQGNTNNLGLSSNITGTDEVYTSGTITRLGDA